ncbi:hypothetical protein B296_00050065 [Ensete ventricosum]|uniref:Uncharacterized protein n=1 Tax=Ensete ventricosum TaxID=4639 RepID=A0A426YHP8_ENSVE|nr:hypothetical protein B296_00050065 [Ensete ventricosum]
MVLPTSNHYRRLFNDPGLTPPDPGLTPPPPSLGPPVVTAEAFLGLTQQVRTLTGMIQAIIPYIPQLAQAPMHQRPNVPRQTLQQEAPSQGQPKENIPIVEHYTTPRSKLRSRIRTPHFRLPTLEPYDGSTDSSEHVAAFRAQMALYDNPSRTGSDVANQYMVVETLVAGKRKDHKKSRGDKPQGQPSGTPKRRDRPELPAPRPLPIPLNST